MKELELLQPEYLFCEMPIKDNSINDNRIWIYHRLSLTLIEFLNVDNFKDFQLNNAFSRYEYENNTGYLENYFAVVIQDNTEFSETNIKLVVSNAWEFLKEYLIWEDENS